MTSWQPDAQEKMRQGFKCFNRVMLTLWRLGLGGWVNLWPSVVGRIMVVVHRGRKTGKRYQTPVNYAIVDGELYCVAGFGGISDWYPRSRSGCPTAGGPVSPRKSPMPRSGCPCSGRC